MTKHKSKGMKIFAISELGGVCNHCGIDLEKSPWLAEFHHKDPNGKETEVGRLIYYKRDPNRVMLEVEKCELLCSNCHRSHHFKEEWLNDENILLEARKYKNIYDENIISSYTDKENKVEKWGSIDLEKASNLAKEAADRWLIERLDVILPILKKHNSHYGASKELNGVLMTRQGGKWTPKSVSLIKKRLIKLDITY